MSESKQQDIRRIEDVTDDEIVDAVVQCGMLGFDPSDGEDDNTTAQICFDLRLYNEYTTSWTQRADIEHALLERMRGMEGRLFEPGGGFNEMIMVHPLEWARRLVGKTEHEIAVALAFE